MRIIHICILIMRMGGKILGNAVPSTNDIITTTETTVNDNNRLEFATSEPEEASVGSSQFNKTFKYLPDADTKSGFTVPSLLGVGLSHQNQSSVQISSLTLQLENTSHLLVNLSDVNATAENAVSDHSKNVSATDVSATDALPVKPVKKILQASSATKEKKLTTSPTVLAKKCCKDNNILSQGNCVASTNPVVFNLQDGNETSYNFSWETKLLNCPVGYVNKELFFDGTSVSLASNKTDSFLKVKESILSKEFTEYCIDQLTNGSHTALICVPDTKNICSSATCVKKCCPADEIMIGLDCKRSDRIFSPLFRTLQGENTSAPDDLRIVTEVPSCPGFATMSFKPDLFYLLATGKFYTKENEDILDGTDYCVEYNQHVKSNVAIYCVERHSIVQDWKIYLMPRFMIISIVCLLIVILCHLITPVLRNVQGYCFMTYTASLMLSYSGFYTNLTYTKQMNSSHCVFNAIFTQSLMLASFFWLSVLCFDIWRVIRASVKGKPLTGILARDGRKFLMYCAYAFGLPALITLITLIMQFVPHEYTEGLIVPGFGKESCWFATKQAQAIYFYSFMAIMNCLSLAMLVHIFYLLLKTEESFTLFFKPRVESRAFNRNHISLFRQRLGLFIMMSVCWFTEVLSLVIPPINMWVVTDLLNTLQGVIVFIIFVSSHKKRKQVLEVLSSTFPCISRILSERRPRTLPRRTPDRSVSNGSSSTASTEVETLPSLWLKKLFTRANTASDAQQEEVKTQGIENKAYDPGNEGEYELQRESNV